MTKKDFILIAEALRVASLKANPLDTEGERKGTMRVVISEFCERLAQINPRFDEEKFRNWIDYKDLE